MQQCHGPLLSKQGPTQKPKGNLLSSDFLCHVLRGPYLKDLAQKRSPLLCRFALGSL